MNLINKRFLLQAPVMQVTDFDQPFVLRTDASDQGVTVVLMPSKGDVLHPMACASRKLLPKNGHTRQYRSAMEYSGQ